MAARQQHSTLSSKSIIAFPMVSQGFREAVIPQRFAAQILVREAPECLFYWVFHDSHGNYSVYSKVRRDSPLPDMRKTCFLIVFYSFRATVISLIFFTCVNDWFSPMVSNDSQVSFFFAHGCSAAALKPMLSAKHSSFQWFSKVPGKQSFSNVLWCRYTSRTHHKACSTKILHSFT